MLKVWFDDDTCVIIDSTLTPVYLEEQRLIAFYEYDKLVVAYPFDRVMHFEGTFAFIERFMDFAVRLKMQGVLKDYIWTVQDHKIVVRLW